MLLEVMFHFFTVSCCHVVVVVYFLFFFVCPDMDLEEDNVSHIELKTDIYGDAATEGEGA